MKTLTIPIPPELEGSFPLVLYFDTQADADEFSRLVQEAKPGMRAQTIDPGTLGAVEHVRGDDNGRA